MDSITFKIAGVTFENFQEVIYWLIIDAGLKEFELERVNHPADPNAIKIKALGVQFGWVPKSINKKLSALLDAGEKYVAVLVQVNKHPDFDNLGVTVRLLQQH